MTERETVARVPSKYQAAIYDWIRTGTGNAVVEAVAGSGKTSTVLEALKLVRGNVLFTAFNASIAAELSRRAPGHVKVSTLHSLGLKAAKKYLHQADVDKDGSKLDGIALDAFPARWVGRLDENAEIRKLAKRAVSLAKATLIDPTSQSEISVMMDRFGIESEDVEDVGPVVRKLPEMLDACLMDRAQIDFDDMIWLPVVMDLHVHRFDWVFVDECQDLNRCQLELIMKTIRPGTRVVCVGDRNQSIYGFRGADTEAMTSTIERLKASVFPLSITYRCPTKHVAMAQAIVPGIEARPDAPEGLVEILDFNEALEMMAPADLVLCRTNAPLARVAFALIRAEKKAVIRGRDIGTGICSLIKKVSGRMGTATPIDLFRDKLELHYQKELKKLSSAGKSTVNLSDKVDTINVLAEGLSTVRELVDRTLRIFDDTSDGIVCSSVHRAKGLEADRVFIIDPDLMPHPMANKAWEYEQEMHIKYVALTRSKIEMYFVPMPKEE
jgi:DNA helicase-2/ATP-dependent DNA helicase PcrA